MANEKNITLGQLQAASERVNTEIDERIEEQLEQYGTATIGTTWTEDEATGVKSQSVAVEGVTAKDNVLVDHDSTSNNGTSEGYAAFVEEENQYLSLITNGYARTYDGGITFYIFGDANTVAIPIIVEVV